MAGRIDPYWAVAAVVAYYVCVWLIIELSQMRRSIVIRYQPPAGLSPAAIRYLYTKTVDGRSYAAIVAQLAAGKFLTILRNEDTGTITLQKLSKSSENRQLSAEEQHVFKDLFEWSDSAELERPELRAIEGIQKNLGPLNKYFSTNLGWILIGLLLTAAGAVWICESSGLFGTDRFERWFESCFAGLTVAMYGLAGYRIWDTNRLAFTLALRGLYRRRALPLLLAFTFLYPALWYALIRTVAPGLAIQTTMLILTNLFAAPLLRNYTPEGRKLRDEIEGFRRFLAESEQDRLQRTNKPGEKSPLDPEMIPYAIALDVREDWGDALGVKAMVETAL